ncbi:MAG: transposase [Anaerolineales bacterium]|nr:transposase [Anaerolineales bacterium]
MHSVEAVVLKLVRPTLRKAQWLESMALSFIQAVQYGLDVAQELKSSNRAKLHQVIYRPAREQFSLPSEYARMAVNAVVTLARSFYGLRNSGHRPSFPKVSRNQGIGLGIHAYSVVCDGERFVLRVSTGSRGQFTWFPLHVPARYRKTIMLTRGDAKLFQRNGNWFVMLPIRISYTPTACGGEPTFIGVDLGIVRHATVATPDRLLFFAGKEARHRREHFFDLRRRYQQHRRIDRVKDQRGKEHRWMADLNHKLSCQIVETASQYATPVIVLERLDGIRYRVHGSKRFNRMVSSWTFRDLVSKIQYKAARIGIPVVFVDPRNTSKTCSRCGHATRSNRPDQATFRCVKCGYRLNADGNAARNIAALGPGAFEQGRTDITRSQDQTEGFGSRPDGEKGCALAHSDPNLESSLTGIPA